MIQVYAVKINLDLINSCFLSIVVNPLPDVPFLRSSDSAANKEVMAKIKTNGDQLSV